MPNRISKIQNVPSSYSSSRTNGNDQKTVAASSRSGSVGSSSRNLSSGSKFRDVFTYSNARRIVRSDAGSTDQGDKRANVYASSLRSLSARNPSANISRGSRSSNEGTANGIDMHHRIKRSDGTDVSVHGNNVHITMSLDYSGPGATPSVINKFNNGIRNYWSGQFGRYNVVTDVVNGSGCDIEVPLGSERAHTWNRRHAVFPARRAGWSAAHEAGHLMGLDDRYNDDTMSADTGYYGNIMAEHGGIPSESDIDEIILHN